MRTWESDGIVVLPRVLRVGTRMKFLNILLGFVLVFALLVPVSALGFDAEKTYNGVFVIYSGNSLGSGFSIGENSIITNAHVIENKDKILVKTYADDSYPATVVLIDPALDIAVLTVPDVTFPYLPVADFKDTAIGEDIYAIGVPNGMSYTLTKGILSAKDRDMGGHKYLQTDAAINSGNSGGPLLNDSGGVIGVNTLKILDNDGIGLSIPMTTVCAFLKENGVALDEKGNVVGSLQTKQLAQDAKATPSGNPQKTTATKAETTQKSMHPIVWVGFIFFIFIALLLIVVTYHINKTKLKKYEANERTDFDIDILE